MKNIGNIDKVVRVIAGLALLSLIFLLEGNNRYWGLLGIIPLATALVGTCPLYSLFGINTCSVKEKWKK